jgi:hypothetical protein
VSPRLRDLLHPRRHPDALPRPEAVAAEVAADVAPGDLAIIERCSPYTLTSAQRVQALLDAVGYCVRRDIPGAFAECGVWRGGSVLAMISKLQDLGIEDRAVYLYDTFEGMTKPSELDTSPFGQPALETWAEESTSGGEPWPEYFNPETFNESTVRELLVSTGYPEDLIRFVKGPVEQTLPVQAPPELALLRLDTDWYESTKHELVHLYPRLSTGGVLVIDDYGHWDGCRQAVDEYFAATGAPLLLNRIDYTGRIAVKA